MITACLSFWDERPESLSRCVRSLDGICSHVVALDGPWELHPADRVRASEEECEAIMEAASGLAGKPRRIRAEIQFSLTTWPSQVAKRAELMRLGIEAGNPWLLVIDGDEWVETCDRFAFHQALRETELDVAQVNQHRYGRGIRTHNRSMRRLYRAATGVTVERAHNGYVTSDGRWLHGDPAYVVLEQPLDTAHLITVAHDLEARTTVRRHAQLAYRSNRRRARAERWR